MTEEKLRKLRVKCEELGIDVNSVQVFDDVILGKILISNLYIYMDSNLNIMYMGKELYGNRVDMAESAFLLRGDFMKCAPIELLSLWQILQVGSKVETLEKNFIFSAQDFSLRQKNTDYYVQILNIVKFIRDEVNNYFLRLEPIITLGLQVPDLFTYIRGLIDRISKYLDEIISHGCMPTIQDVLVVIGETSASPLTCQYLSRIIHYLLMRKGYKVGPVKIEPLEEGLSDSEAFLLNKNVLNILDIKDEEFYSKDGIYNMTGLVNRISGDARLRVK